MSQVKLRTISSLLMALRETVCHVNNGAVYLPLFTPSLSGVLYLFNYFLRSALNYLGRTGTFILIILVALYFQGQYEFIYRAIQHYISTETARLSSDNVRISAMYFASYLLTIHYYLSVFFHLFTHSIDDLFFFCCMTYEERVMTYK